MYVGPPHDDQQDQQSTSDAYTYLCRRYHSTAADPEGHRGPVIVFVRNDISSLCAAISLVRLLSNDGVYTNVVAFTEAREYGTILNHLAERMVSQEEYISRMNDSKGTEGKEVCTRKGGRPKQH